MTPRKARKAGKLERQKAAFFEEIAPGNCLHMANIHQEQHSIKNMQVTFLKSCLLYSFVWGQEMSDFQTVFFVYQIKDV